MTYYNYVIQQNDVYNGTVNVNKDDSGVYLFSKRIWSYLLKVTENSPNENYVICSWIGRGSWLKSRVMFNLK